MISRHAAFAAIVLAALTLPLAVTAQPVLLQIRPHIGDTINMRMDQTVEMIGTTRGPGPDSSRTMSTSMEVYTRSVAQRNVRGGTVMLGIADSITVRTRDSRKPAPSNATRRLGGQTVEMRISMDGAVEMLAGDADPDLRTFFAEMPATLPKTPVKPGDRWTREMAVPLSGDTHTKGWVRATFTLDSLGRNGDLAFISMKGTLTHEASAPATDVTGQISGSMQLNRRLGWITDSRAAITLRSMIARAKSPMKVETRITQWLRTAPAR